MAFAKANITKTDFFPTGVEVSDFHIHLEALYHEENLFLVHGAGSAEGIVVLKISQRAGTVESKEQIAVERFADAGEEIPLTLARNLGMNVLVTLILLWTKFQSLVSSIMEM